jgi:hypothetical protein
MDVHNVMFRIHVEKTWTSNMVAPLLPSLPAGRQGGDASKKARRAVF